jgi:hypothetical protein
MRKAKAMDVVLGLFALALIYVIVSTNSSITGFVIGPPTTIELTTPADNTETTQNSITFIFKYPPEVEIKECSLVMDSNVVKKLTDFLSPYGTRTSMELKPGTYQWGVECIDTNNITIGSAIRNLRISTPQEVVGLQKLPGSSGFIYQFVLKDNLVLSITDVRSGDVLRVKRGEDTYLVSVLKIAQDYNRGLTFSELLITPGDKRIMLNPAGTTTIDFNNDGQDDIDLTLDAISYGRAIFTVKGLKQQVLTPAQTASTPDMTLTTTSEGSNGKPRSGSIIGTVPKLGSSALLPIALAITLVVLIVIMVLVKNRALGPDNYAKKLEKEAVSVETKSSAKKKAKKK